MADGPASGVSGSIQTHVFAKAGHTDPVPSAYADIVGAGKVVPVLGTDKTASVLEKLTGYVKDCIDIGDLGDSANILRYTPFGQPTERTLPGVSGLAEWTFTVALNEADTVHKALRSAQNGNKWEFAIATITDLADGDDEVTVDYIRGQIASKPKSFSTGDATSMTVTVALNIAPIDAHAG